MQPFSYSNRCLAKRSHTLSPSSLHKPDNFQAAYPTNHFTSFNSSRVTMVRGVIEELHKFRENANIILSLRVAKQRVCRLCRLLVGFCPHTHLLAFSCIFSLSLSCIRVSAYTKTLVSNVLSGDKRLWSISKGFGCFQS